MDADFFEMFNGIMRDGNLITREVLQKHLWFISEPDCKGLHFFFFTQNQYLISNSSEGSVISKFHVPEPGNLILELNEYTIEMEGKYYTDHLIALKPLYNKNFWW